MANEEQQATESPIAPEVVDDEVEGDDTGTFVTEP